MNLVIRQILEKISLNYLLVLIIAIYSFYINWTSANVGVMAIDTTILFIGGVQTPPFFFIEITIT